jgi:stage II sporulation protein AB (anti-sigma F factor)
VHGATTIHLSLSLEAVPVSVREARRAVVDAVVPLGVDERELDDIRLCVSEAVANAVRHAYDGEGGDVAVVVEEGDDELLVAVRDWGGGVARVGRGDGGYGLKIIERLATRIELDSDADTGTEISMAFPLSTRSSNASNA